MLSVLIPLIWLVVITGILIYILRNRISLIRKRLKRTGLNNSMIDDDYGNELKNLKDNKDNKALNSDVSISFVEEPYK